MNARRVNAIFRRVVEEIRRDRPSLAILFVAPVLMTGLVTFILRGGTTPPIHALVVNEAGPRGAIVVAALDQALLAQDPAATVTIASDEAAARGAVEDGSATIAIVLPPVLGATTPPTAATTFTVITEGLDPTGEAGQVGTLQKAMLSVAASLAGRPLPALQHVTVFGVPSSDPITTYAPAIVGFLVYFFVYILTGVSFLRERTGGTLERLLATPVTRSEIVAGYTLGFGVFAVVQVVVMLLWSLGTLTVPAVGPLSSFQLGLGIQLAGSPLLAFLVVLLA
ncbi:MAG TPA: ABC transporter permease, partial [Candidatus Limnocylindrales bacterium]